MKCLYARYADWSLKRADFDSVAHAYGNVNYVMLILCD